MNLANSVQNLCDRPITKNNNRHDEESLDSRLHLQISQESTIVTETGLGHLMVANPRRTSDVPVARASLLVHEKGCETENCDTCGKELNQTVCNKAAASWKIKKQVKSLEHKYTNYFRKPNTKHQQDDSTADHNDELLPEKSKTCRSCDCEDNSMLGYRDAGASFYRDTKEHLKNNCSDSQLLSVEDLFTRRKMATEDSELLASRQVDHIIRLRHDSATAATNDDNDDATVAKQPIASASAGTNRLVLRVTSHHLP